MVYYFVPTNKHGKLMLMMTTVKGGTTAVFVALVTV